MKTEKTRKKLDTDYNALFIVGIIFFIIGYARDMPALWIIGAVFFIAGLSKKRDRDANN